MLKLLTETRSCNSWATSTELDDTCEWTPRPLEVGLLERDAELARIEQAIAALGRGHGGVLVIQGAAGIGKSATNS